VLANGGTAARYEVKATTDGRAYVTLKAVNGEVIGPAASRRPPPPRRRR
jgi:hypothetical protein